MVTVAAHGGLCCGARHIYGFDNHNTPEDIDRALASIPKDRMVEVILNQRQVDAHQHVLNHLARRGFVFDGRWINGNHNRTNYRFTRCDNRLPLSLPQWNGMVADPDLAGALPSVPGTVGQTRTVEGHLNIPIRERNDRGRADDRHVFSGMVRPYPLPPAPPAPAPQEVRRVGVYWHCVFRDGRRGAGYQTFADATRNLGRRTRIDRFEIMSDGTTRWVENARN
jgi:hypothetical protein